MTFASPSPHLVGDAPGWVMDTSTYTHFHRAGHGEVLRDTHPGRLVLVPNDVAREIEAGRELHQGIDSVEAVDWARVVVLTDREVLTQLAVKEDMGGRDTQHLGECAVIACAASRGMVAVLDERAAVAQAKARGVAWVDSLTIVAQAHVELFDGDGTRTAAVVDDLLATGMYLPPDVTGEGFVAWAYVEGLLPR